MKKLLAVSLLLGAALGGNADNIPNPILRNVADIGVMKYNGKYYLGGCRTDGDFYISSDLVNWEGPIHVIDMDNDWSKGSGCGNNQIHANDMQYDNGTIHAYWSVNYWGRDKHAVHVVHSEASDPMGPYKEPIRDRWMDNRIDPKVFRDDDGKLYMYMVRFTDGNTIWGRRMKNWREFVDDNEPDAIRCMFSSNPNTWERYDNAVAEGPWVIKYHGQYYMMYNANHTGGDWGNYQLGIAQAQDPMGFNNGNKYPYPVVYPNQFALEENSTDLLAYTGEKYTPLYSYTTTPPAADWYKPGFNAAGWGEGPGGFANYTPRGTTLLPMGTKWDTDHIWLRKNFTVSNLDDNLTLRITSRGATKVYLNGTEIYNSDKGEYKIVNFTPEIKKLVKKGENLLAIESTAGRRRGGYINACLFDTGKSVAEPEITCTPGQPNILRGPNGLEWWLIYMANHNDEGRDQYVDRVHFHGDKLVVDGISRGDNPGYHPAPALPAYGDTFDGALDASKWNNLDASRWSVSNGQLQSAPAGKPLAATLNPALAAQSYLWEVNVKPEETAGVYAAYIDKDNNVAVLFDRPTNSWTIVETVNGKPSTIASTPLRSDFRWDVYHQIRLERDLADLIVSIDEMRVNTPFTTAFAQAAVPGLLTMGAPAAYDGIIYTIGFDDGNDRMNGWREQAGSLIPTKRGAIASGNLKAFKGTLSDKYEFTAQISSLGDNARAGIYPLYVDENNYVLAEIDAPSKQLVVTTVQKGKTVSTKNIPLDRMHTLYTDQRFTDSYDKGYTFDVPTTFDAIYLPRYDVANRNTFSESRFDKEAEHVRKAIVHDNTFSLMTPSVVAADGSWQEIPVDNAKIDPTNPQYNVATFAPVKASRMRFINNNPEDGASHIYKIRVHELFKDSYNLRADRDADGNLYLLVDGVVVDTIPAAKFAPSTVGLSSAAGVPEFHGVTYYTK